MKMTRQVRSSPWPCILARRGKWRPSHKIERGDELIAAAHVDELLASLSLEHPTSETTYECVSWLRDYPKRAWQRSTGSYQAALCCAESSVDRDCVLVPEIFLTVQGGRRFLSRRRAKERWQCLRQ